MTITAKRKKATSIRDEVLAMFKESEKRSKETDKKFQETRESIKETDRMVKEVSRQLGAIGNNNGRAAEDYFYNSFNERKKFGREKFDYAEQNIKLRADDLQDEYDIVLYNGKCIGIIEVKYTAQPQHIAQTINKVTTFRQLFPLYRDFTFYLGLASFSFEKNVEKLALTAGIAVIKQVGDHVVVQDQRIKKF